MKFFFLFWMAILLLLIVIAKWKGGKEGKRVLDMAAMYWIDKSSSILEVFFGEKYRKYKQKEAEILRALFPSQEQGRKQCELDCRRWKLVWLVLFLGSGMGLVGCLVQSPVDSQSSVELQRPAFGEGEEIVRRRLEYGGDSQEIILSLQEREPTVEQIKERLHVTFEELGEKILGENESLQQVSRDLDLSLRTLADVEIKWKSLNPEQMDDTGHILAEEIPESGYLVELQVTLSYGGEQEINTFGVHIVPQPKDWNWIHKKIEKIVQQQEGENQKTIFLPEEIENETLVWGDAVNNTWQIFALCILIVAIGFYFLCSKQLKENYQKREVQLEEDYCHVVSMMSMLLAGGMTIRAAWGHIVSHYNRTGGTRLRYVYEEMRITLREIGNGMSEAYAYHKFGLRCKSYHYMRFAHLLEQGVKQGSTDLAAVLEEESMRALEEHKNARLKKGEKMQTTLLIPMFLMLGVVIVVLIVPAFLNIGMTGG